MRLTPVTSPADHAMAAAVISSVRNGRLVFAGIRDDERLVAIGRGAITPTAAGNPVLGVTALHTLSGHRGRGLGGQVLAALLGWGRDLGAGTAYLQVDAANRAAGAWYRRLGSACTTSTGTSGCSGAPSWPTVVCDVRFQRAGPQTVRTDHCHRRTDHRRPLRDRPAWSPAETTTPGPAPTRSRRRHGQTTFRTSPKPTAPRSSAQKVRAKRAQPRSGLPRAARSPHALATLELIDAGQWPDAADAPGTRGGINFRNNEGLLPAHRIRRPPPEVPGGDVNPKKRAAAATPNASSPPTTAFGLVHRRPLPFLHLIRGPN